MRGGIRTSAGNYNLNTQAIKKILIPLPDQTEQNNIINLVMELRNQYLKNQIYLEQLKETKSALMQVLLTGEVRAK